MGKIDIKKKLKEKALFQSAFDLFMNKGFAKTTISDIAEKAELAKGTFYFRYRKGCRRRQGDFLPIF